MSTKSTRDRYAQLREMCVTRGLRLTPQRDVLLRALAATKAHPTVIGSGTRAPQDLPRLRLFQVKVLRCARAGSSFEGSFEGVHQSMIDAPHVKPEPNATHATIMPRLSLPLRSDSARRIGIVAAVVLP